MITSLFGVLGVGVEILFNDVVDDAGDGESRDVDKPASECDLERAISNFVRYRLGLYFS